MAVKVWGDERSRMSIASERPGASVSVTESGCTASYDIGREEAVEIVRALREAFGIEEEEKGL